MFKFYNAISTYSQKLSTHVNKLSTVRAKTQSMAHSTVENIISTHIKALTQPKKTPKAGESKAAVVPLPQDTPTPPVDSPQSTPVTTDTASQATKTT